MTGKRIGYVRVSTIDQNPDRQLEGVQLDKKFTDRASAKTTNRPQLHLMMDFVREDDIVIVHSMDRMARNLRDLRSIVDNLVSRKIEVQFMKENLSFTGNENPMSNLMLSLMGAFAEFEYAFMRERQAEGIKTAKAAGKFKGSKPKLNGLQVEQLRAELKTRKSKTKIAEDLGIARETMYRYIKKFDLLNVEGALC